MNPYAISNARLLIEKRVEYDMTPTQAQDYLDSKPSVGVWAGSPEGEMIRGHISDMTLCARYALWVESLVQKAIQEMIE